MSAKVLVVGSINVDCTVQVADLPLAGETIHGTEPLFLPGGKGGNQAVSAVTNGAEVVMIGAVGNDEHGVDALKSLESAGVSIAGVDKKSGSTGTAFIFVEAQGENLIVVTAGANALVTPEEVETKIRQYGGEQPVVLCQLELPLESVLRAAEVAQQLDGRFILNLAPAEKISNSLLEKCDPIVLNETEASLLSGEKIDSVDEALKVVQQIAKTARSAVITLGELGAVYSDGQTSAHLPSEKVTVVDTTGAGDAFVGALATAFSQDKNLAEAVAKGLKAGAAAVQHFGAQAPKS